MKVRAKEKCFVDGSLRYPGDVFTYNGPSARYLEILEEIEHIEILEGPKPEELYPGKDSEYLRGKLAEYGVKSAPRTGRDKLAAMLQEIEAK